MGDRVQRLEPNYKLREDEEDVDFGDTRSLASRRYDFTVAAVKQNLSPADCEKVSEPLDWQTLQSDIRARVEDSNALPVTQRLLSQIIPFPRSLATLVAHFTRAIQPYEPDINFLWGVVALNIKLACVAPEKLQRTVGWMKRLRSSVELFNRCLAVCEDMNEPRYAMVDVLDALLQIQGESVQYLRRFSTNAEGTTAWRALEARISESIVQMDASIKHLNDINAYTRVNLERANKNLTLRHAQVTQPEENVTFPCTRLPRNKNINFYGRTAELQNIDKFLGHKSPNLRTYTIYGRRGVGKTDIALEYAHTNPSNFDAIFWVNCETSVALRQSFSDIAVELNIPGADRNGHHEENQLAVLKWLKTTKRQWLLIYDNAERDFVLKGYWPVSVKGSILITSRKYYNFTNDAHRKGETVKPFTDQQGWKLLMKLLGPEWVEKDEKGLLKGTEERAAKELLKSLGGLALAIEQAAELIKNDAIGGPNITSTYELFKERQKDLPERAIGMRSDTVHALDSLWDMRFTNLSRNSLALLSVLSLLSPDGILIDLFLPRNQKALDGRLQFCKQNPSHEDPSAQTALSTVIRIPALLRAALDELVSFKLIKQEGRELWAHREVQEAMNYHSAQDLQDFFDSAVALVYEAFPKQEHGDYLSSQWGACETYISHGAHLSFRFAGINRKSVDNRKLIGSKKFIDLLSNCARYLYEVSDYSLCLQLVETASAACDDKESLQFANLCGTSGSAYYELNQLKECRKAWEIFLQIQEAKLPENNLELSSSYHNMGNLEQAEGNTDEAMKYFKKAISIRIERGVDGGDTAAFLLAISYLCISRVYFLLGDYDESLNMVAQSEALFFRTSGADAQFMAHVHYAYGNIDFAQNSWAGAKRAYEASLKICLASFPIHPITAAAYYSLGCVEEKRGNLDNARAYLDKAMAIAQLRSPDRDDGTMARIMWRTSVVLESDTYGTYAEEATALRNRAELAMRELSARGEGGVVLALDEEGVVDQNEMEEAFDSLVPGYFR